MKPLTRKEMLLDGAAKGNLDDFKPATREEVFAKRALANAGGGTVGTVVEKTITVEANSREILDITMYDETVHYLPIELGEKEEYVVRRQFALIEGETYIFTDMDGVEHAGQAVKQGGVISFVSDDYSCMLDDLGTYRTAVVCFGSVTAGMNSSSYSLKGKFLKTEVDDEPMHTVRFRFSESGMKALIVDGKFLASSQTVMAFPLILFSMSSVIFSAEWSTGASNDYQDTLLLQLKVSTYSSIVDDIKADVFGYCGWNSSATIKKISLISNEVNDGGVG